MIVTVTLLTMWSIIAGVAIGRTVSLGCIDGLAKSHAPLDVNGKKHYLIPFDDLSAELWVENEAMRKTLDMLRECVHRNVTDYQLAVGTTAAMDEDVAADICFTLIEARAIFAHREKVF